VGAEVTATLIRISSRDFTAAVVADAGRIVEAAPILRWALRRRVPAGELATWAKGKGWRVDVIDDPRPEQRKDENVELTDRVEQIMDHAPARKETDPEWIRSRLNTSRSHPPIKETKQIVDAMQEVVRRRNRRVSSA